MSITGVGEVATLANTAINKLWPDKTEQEREQLAAAVVVVQGQLAVNKAEAENPSVFVSGWRPFIGWVCGAAFFWNWIGLPVSLMALAILEIEVKVLPADLLEMMPVLLGMLGLGALRTKEKIEGVTR